MDFLESLRSAMDTTDQFAYIERVKRVVHRELEGLDPTAQIADTKYFNHSAIPDFILRWPGERGERRVYLRDSYASMAAGRDSQFLREGDPVLLSLEEAELGSLERVDSPVSVDPNDRMLVTDVDAVELISDSAEASDEPLGQIIRANFVRGAHGRVDRPVAESLLGPRGGDGASVRSRADEIAGTFFPDAAYRITRTAALIDIATTDAEATPAPLAEIIDGRLSLTELRTVLPWLLKQESVGIHESFWREFGSLTTFGDIEKVRDALEGLNLTPIVEANADRWEARWGYLGVSTPIVGEVDVDRRRNYWSFVRGSLGFDYGDRRLSVASNGQLMPKVRTGRGSAEWQDLQASLQGVRLARVGLTGIRRSISVTAEQSPDIRADIEEIANSIADSYRVTELTIRVPPVPGYEGLADIALDFGSATVSATSGASLGAVASATAGLMDRSGVEDAVASTRAVRPRETLTG